MNHLMVRTIFSIVLGLSVIAIIPAFADNDQGRGHGRIMRRRSGEVLRCAQCDAEVPEGAAACSNRIRHESGGRRYRPCGSRAFYRGRPPARSIIAPAIEREPEAGRPMHARSRVRGRGPIA